MHLNAALGAFPRLCAAHISPSLAPSLPLQGPDDSGPASATNPADSGLLPLSSLVYLLPPSSFLYCLLYRDLSASAPASSSSAAFSDPASAPPRTEARSLSELQEMCHHMGLIEVFITEEVSCFC
jgi:hypothetical protein